MNPELIGILATFIGGIIGALIAYLGTKKESQTEKFNQFQDNILDQLDKVQGRVDRLEKQVTTWKIRYWALYVQILKKHEISPPEFHKMNLNELQKGYHNPLKDMKKADKED